MSEPTGETEPLYAVPSHLSTSDSIGFIPTRTFYVGLGMIVCGALPGLIGWQRYGILGIAFALIVVPIFAPFMLWFLSPAPEHGLIHWFMFRFARKTLRAQHIKSLQDVEIDEDGVIHTPSGVRRILVLPTINLDLASVGAIRRHRRLIGQLFDGITTHEFQLLLRAEVQSQQGALDRMRLNRNPFARKLADWLAQHHQQKETIDRRRYLIIPAPDLDVLNDRVESIARSLEQANLKPEWLTDPLDVRDLLNGWWTWRPHPDRLGAETVIRSANYAQSDGEFVRAYALGKTPGAIGTNWWLSIVDRDLPCDVSMRCVQQPLALAKWRLDLKYNQLASSRSNPARQIAISQVRKLRLAFETKTRPWDVQVLFVVRGHDLKTLDKRCLRLEQQFKDLGGSVRRMRWEHYEALAAAQPLCLDAMPSRQLYWESGTLARTTLFGASTLQMRDGVPWGMSGATPILITTRGMRTGRHFGWFGFTGSGKGFGLRTYLARRHFADRLRIFMWDADDAQHEYAGRFCDFLGGVRLTLDSLDDALRVEIDPLWQVVAFDVSSMPDTERPRAFAHITQIVEKHVVAFPGETAFVLDEAMLLAEAPDQTGARALGIAVQTWRKRGIEMHVVTQRVSDWFGTPLGRKVQGNLAVKWYGAQEDSELYEVANRVGLSAEERERVGAAGIGQGLLVAFGRRVWSDLYDHTSPDEYQAYHTDPPDRVEILNTRKEAVA